MVLDRIDALESQIRHLANIVEMVAQTTMPPINRDVPYVNQVDATTLGCTMGNWMGVPTGYAYQWLRDGAAAGTGTPYTLVAADAGHSLSCVVTATNANGSTAAPPSNAIAIPAAAVAEAAAHEPEHAARAPQRK